MTAEGTPQLLVSQTGGTYIPLWYQEVPKEGEERRSDFRPRNESSLSQDDSLGLTKDDKESPVSMNVSGDETGLKE